MTIFQSIILGIVQGITEFIPISSSGHLVLTTYLLGWDIPQPDSFIFNVLVQVGSLLAVIIYFWKDLISIARSFLAGLWKRQPFADHQSRLGWYLILATLPASALGLSIRTTVEDVFVSPTVVAFFLLGTALLLLIAERAGKRARSFESITWVDALIMGASQAVALFPGVSRSGATIAGGMIRDLDRPTAARFSFLMSVPVMVAAGLLAFIDLIRIPDFVSMLPPYIAGFITAAVAGYLSIHWLLGYLARRPLYIFAGYVTALALVILLVAALQGQQTPVQTVLPTPQVVRASLSASVAPIGDALRICASDHGDSALVFEESFYDPENLPFDLYFQLGAPSPIPPFAAPLIDEEVLVIIHPENPVSRIRTEELEKLFAGQITSWEPLGGPDAPLSVWEFPPGEATRAIFDAALSLENSANSLAYLAPDPAAMLEAVASEPGALGYLPGAWIDQSVKIVELDFYLAQKLNQPVLALAESEPSGFVRSFLACLQSGLGQSIIRERYGR
jgi:undecaprenyl-diphosphatase